MQKIELMIILHSKLENKYEFLKKNNWFFDLILNAFWWKFIRFRKISLSKLGNRGKQKSLGTITFEIFVHHYQQRSYSPILIFENFPTLVVKLNCICFHNVHVHYLWIIIVSNSNIVKWIVLQIRFPNFSTSLLHFQTSHRIYNYLIYLTLSLKLLRI